MRKSIRTRIAITFIVLTALVLVAIGVFQHAFLNTYYLRNKQKTLIESWNLICTSDTGDSVPESFEQFCSVNSLTYCITDATLTEWQTNASDGRQLSSKLFGLLVGKEDENSEILLKTEQYTMIRHEDERYTGLTTLELWGMVPDGSYYLVTCPIDSLTEAAGISMRFYLYIGIVAACVGALVIWFVSGKLEETVSRLQSEKEKLERDIEEKERVDAMRREFLSNVSHELKTPIALIQGYAEGLRDNVIEDPESRIFYSDVIVDEAGKMNRMVQQITSLNQLEFGEDELVIESFDLSALIRGVLEKMHMMIEQAKAQVFFSQTEPLFVKGDAFRIEEVVTNYMTNALHHLEGGRTIDISCRIEGNTVETSVFNEGRPIPEEELEKIWIKFYKIDKARTRAYGGSGIGLSIVKAIMDAHGQSCRAVNFENGVSFCFTLSLVSSEEKLLT